MFTRTMHQFTTPSLSETFWARWASRQFLILPIVQTLLPVNFGYPWAQRLFLWDNWGDERGCDEGHWHAHTRGLLWAFQKLLEQYNKCIAAGGDYIEGDLSFMCVLSIKVPIRKKPGNLFNDPRITIPPDIFGFLSHHGNARLGCRLFLYNYVVFTTSQYKSINSIMLVLIQLTR